MTERELLDFMSNNLLEYLRSNNPRAPVFTLAQYARLTARALAKRDQRSVNQEDLDV